MTLGRAVILKSNETCRDLNYGLTKIEIQKLGYLFAGGWAISPVSMKSRRGSDPVNRQSKGQVPESFGLKTRVHKLRQLMFF